MAASAFMFALEGAQLITTLITGLMPQPDQTKVQIIVGSSDTDDTLGGNAPYVGLWDNKGRWMGTYQPRERNKLWGQGKTIEGADGGISIKHQGNADPRASYILLSNCDSNAICISQISISDNSVQTYWSGDMGKYCGMPWYPSTNEIGSTRKMVKCVWLDGDNSNNLPQAMSFQLDAFAVSNDKAAQYKEYKDTLCKSTPRFSTWKDLDWNSPIPYFDPPLKYMGDFATEGQGADQNFSQIVDSDLCKYDKEKERKLKLEPSCEQKGVKASMPGPTGEAGRKRSDKDQNPEDTLRARFARQLVVSSKGSHSAKEVCDSETSFGPDFISTEEGVFCSMSQKKTFPVCGREGSSTDDACFDLYTNTLAIAGSKDTGNNLRIRETLPATNYSLVRRW